MLYFADLLTGTIDNPFRVLRVDGVKTMEGFSKETQTWLEAPIADSNYRRGQDYNCYEITEKRAKEIIEKWNLDTKTD